MLLLIRRQLVAPQQSLSQTKIGVICACTLKTDGAKVETTLVIVFTYLSPRSPKYDVDIRPLMMKKHSFVTPVHWKPNKILAS